MLPIGLTSSAVNSVTDYLFGSEVARPSDFVEEDFSEDAGFQNQDSKTGRSTWRFAGYSFTESLEYGQDTWHEEIEENMPLHQWQRVYSTTRTSQRNELGNGVVMLLVLKLPGRGFWLCADPVKRVQRVNVLNRARIRTRPHPRVNYGQMPGLNRFDQGQLEGQAEIMLDRFAQNQQQERLQREQRERDHRDRRHRGGRSARSRALHGILGGFTTLMGWGWARRRFGTLLALAMSVINNLSYLGVFEWAAWGSEKAREGVELYDSHVVSPWLWSFRGD